MSSALLVSIDRVSSYGHPLRQLCFYDLEKLSHVFKHWLSTAPLFRGLYRCEDVNIRSAEGREFSSLSSTDLLLSLQAFLF